MSAKENAEYGFMASQAAAVKPVQERNTRQKRAIRETFVAATRPLTVEEVHAEVQRNIDGIGIATVYRAIRAMLDEGWLDTVEVPGRSTLYERSGKEHHHHFLCERCQRVFELDGCSSQVNARLPSGFQATGHDVTIYGLCKQCRRPSVARSGKPRR